MKYIRSRPWRSRGPWFSNRVGARRRGHASDVLLSTSADEITDGYGDAFAFEVTAETQDVGSDDALLQAPTPLVISEQMLVASLDDDHVLAGAHSQVPANRDEQGFDRIPVEVMAASMRSQQHNDDAGASRRSA